MRAALAALVLCLAGSPALQAQDDVPFVVTPDNVTLAMLELARVGPQDFVLDLGSGDGRIVILAARRFGARGVGVEIVPELVERSRRNAARAGVAERAKFLSTIPIGRFSQPEDLGNAACFLCSDEASMITGVAMEVDGGRCI